MHTVNIQLVLTYKLSIVIILSVIHVRNINAEFL